MVDKPQDPQVLAALALLRMYPGAGQQARALAGDLFDDLVTLRGEVIAANWTGVFAAAMNCLGRGTAAFERLRGEASIEAAEIQDTQRVVAEATDIVERVVASGVGSEWVAVVREQLDDDPELLTELEPDLQAIEEGRAVDIGFLADAVSAETEDPSGAFRVGESFREPVVAALTRGLLGLVHAELNQALDRIAVPADGWPGIEEAFAYETARFDERLRRRQVAIYSALSTGSIGESVDELRALTTFLEQDLPCFARAQARVRLAIQALLADGEHGSAEELGRLGTRAGELTREAVASQAAAYRLALELIDPATEGGELRRQAASSPFDTPLPSGTPTPLADVNETQDGAFVEVEGFVSQIRVSRSSDGKLLGELRLSDPSSDAAAFAVALFVQPLHVGITLGAFARVNGIFRAKSQLRDEEPAVEADRLSLASLAQEAWRLSFLHSAAPFYEYWRNQTNMYWSLGPHEEVREDAVAMEGAGELIYTPFVRES